MLYIERDENGSIIALHKRFQDGFEEVDLRDEEVLAFLEGSDKNAVNSALEDSDKDLVRVMEDLIYLLIDKNIIRFTDLPSIAQQKILNRQKMRNRLADDNFMVDEII